MRAYALFCYSSEEESKARQSFVSPRATRRDMPLPWQAVRPAFAARLRRRQQPETMTPVTPPCVERRARCFQRVVVAFCHAPEAHAQCAASPAFAACQLSYSAAPRARVTVMAKYAAWHSVRVLECRRAEECHGKRCSPLPPAAPMPRGARRWRWQRWYRRPLRL